MDETKTDPPPPEDPAAYYLEIESHFAARRGTAFLFSSKDWALMEEWRREGVPLPVVIEAIDHCFDKKSEGTRRKKTISSLSYCRHAVLDLWEDRRQLQVGRESAIPERDSADLLLALASRVEAAALEAGDQVGPILAVLAGELRSRQSNDSVQALEEWLIEREQTLVDDILAALPAAEVERLEGETDRLLAGHTLEESLLARTRAASLRRLVRETIGLPRLSLFG